MRPKSLSASAFQVAQACLARYEAEYINRGRGIQSSAANVGITCHDVFENFLRDVFKRKTAVWDEAVFLEYFEAAYKRTFGSDKSLPEYEDALNLCLRWFRRDGNREYLEGVRILSMEAKNNFEIPTSIGKIPVNYIMDRLDEISPGVYKIVDYKSNRVPLTEAQLRKKLQARLYALAIQIIHKDADGIWVEFDFLRHKPVAVKFSRDDNVATWLMLKAEAQRIVDTPDGRAPETLNVECNWCVRKASCKALTKNHAVGGTLSSDLQKLALQYKHLTEAIKGQQALMDEIEGILVAQAVAADTLEIELPMATVEITAAQRRKPNHAAIAAILGDDLAKEYAQFRTSDMDALIKSGKLNPAQVLLLQKAMPKELGALGVKIHMAEEEL